MRENKPKAEIIQESISALLYAGGGGRGNQMTGAAGVACRRWAGRRRRYECLSH